MPYPCAEEDLQWAGMTCTDDDPCPVYLELTSVTAQDRALFVAGDLHSTSATLASVLLQTGDAGATWKETAARIRGSAVDQLQFFDAQHGWAAGETQYPLPRDPFVLVTADGGALWTRSDIGEEGNAGSVLGFRFDSAEHGRLMVDRGATAQGGRYATWESETGGGTWTLRSTADKPADSELSAHRENSDWRIAAGKDGAAYQVERRNGDRWTSIASFSIDAATCRGAPEKDSVPADHAPANDGSPAAPKR